MKFLKRFLAIAAVFIFTMLLFFGQIYRSVVKYQILPSGSRASFTLKTPSFKNWIDENSKQNALYDINAIIDHTLNLTAKRLEFTTSSAQIDPNRLYLSKKANCIGYASFFNTVCNYLIQKQGLTEQYEANHLVGKLRFLGFDLHKISDNPFMKDHDFNVIVKTQDQTQYYVDPSVYDYLNISRVTLKGYKK